MGTKNNPGKFDCFSNALPDEPMFILLARDQFAPDLVREWAANRYAKITGGDRPKEDTAMVAEANDCAQAMVDWRAENDGKWRESAAQEKDGAAAIDYIDYRDMEGKLLWSERMVFSRLWAVGDILTEKSAHWKVRRVALAGSIQHVNVEPARSLF